MTAPAAGPVTAIPGLGDVDPGKLAALGDTPLAHSIALYLERLSGHGTAPRGSFNSSI